MAGTDPRLRVTLLAESNGYALARRGPVLVFVDRSTQLTAAVGFVTSLLALMLTANALAQLGLLLLGSPRSTASGVVAFLATAALFGVGAWRLRGLLAQRSALPLEDIQALALVDLEDQTLLDADGALLSPLPAVTISRRWQLTGPSLVARWPGGSRTLASGSLIGPLGPIEAALRGEGLL